MVYGDVHKAFYEDRKQFYVIIGAQWGDEGKGKLVDWIVSIMANNDAKKVLVARFNGGSNAGNDVTLCFPSSPSPSFLVRGLQSSLSSVTRE